jgi:superfamily II DNA or RNA helicase
VVVKGVVYNVDDDDFNETQYDYKGNPKFSTMISKLCSYSHRSEFILRLLTAELELNPEQQIMILAHNKSLITYLHEAIAHRKIADGSVGYYIGGMKEAALKLSESKKVIIATYAMASEGLDIKTLTTLILASPKTDVCQSVGRILRQKHSSPLVIDIIDAHDIFMSQWYKRRKYYKSQNYKVLVCDNEQYEAGHNKDLSKWKVSWEPKQAGGGKAAKGVSKKIHPAAAVAASKPKVAEKSIAERLNININIKRVEKSGYDDDESVDLDDRDDRENDTEDEDEVIHERRRNESRGKSGLNGKGCLIDMSMFGKL